MRTLKANSTNRLVLEPDVFPLDTVTLEVDRDGETVEAPTVSIGEGVYYADLPSEDSQVGEYRVTWTLESGDTVATEVEFFRCFESDPLLDQLKNIVRVESDDLALTEMLTAAKSALRNRFKDTFPTVPSVQESRWKFVDGCRLDKNDLVSADEVTDVNGNTIGFVDMGDHLRFNWMRCDVSISGTWGYDEYPERVARAIVLTAALWYQRDNGGLEGEFSGIRRSIPSEALELMR
jgi:hypothetical protein